MIARINMLYHFCLLFVSVSSFVSCQIIITERSLSCCQLKIIMHTKCRNAIYPFSSIKRLYVSDDLVPWSKEWTEYNPPQYSSNVLQNKPWADPDITNVEFKPKWNEIDKDVNRVSYNGPYKIENKYPLNPVGRTGLRGRGILGRWGPNHAADPIVTRWKRTNDGNVIQDPLDLKPILQFCAIQRRDNQQWALPGGMVDSNEHVSQTLRREFQEEAMNSLEATEDAKIKMNTMINKFFENGTCVYRGYVDDPRNTDNSWMETVAYNFHDETGTEVGKFSLNAGDDAKSVQWMDISSTLDLYASHSSFLKLVCEQHKAYW